MDRTAAARFDSDPRHERRDLRFPERGSPRSAPAAGASAIQLQAGRLLWTEPRERARLPVPPWRPRQADRLLPGSRGKADQDRAAARGLSPTQSRSLKAGSRSGKRSLDPGPASSGPGVQREGRERETEGREGAGFPQVGRLLLENLPVLPVRNYMRQRKSFRVRGFGGIALAYLRLALAYLRSNVSVPSVQRAETVSVPSGKPAIFHRGEGRIG